MTTLEVDVREPAGRHTVTVQQIQRWADSTATTARERLKGGRVRALLGKG
jgi:hypothetical protein